jgi:hypothetical protein
MVSEATATGADIAPIVDKIEVALKGEGHTNVLIALCSVMLLLQNPALDQHQLFEGVKDVSRYICLWLSTTTPEGVPGDSTTLIIN